jgi:hypothetical protein
MVIYTMFSLCFSVVFLEGSINLIQVRRPCLETLDLLHQSGLGGELPRRLLLASQGLILLAQLLASHRGDGVASRGGGALGGQRGLHLRDLGLALLVAVASRGCGRCGDLDHLLSLRGLRGLRRGDGRRGRAAGRGAILPGLVGLEDGLLRGRGPAASSPQSLRHGHGVLQGELGVGCRLNSRTDDLQVGVPGRHSGREHLLLLGLVLCLGGGGRGLLGADGLLAADGLLETLEDGHRQLQLLCEGELGGLVEGLILEGDCCGGSGSGGGGGHFNG